MNSNLAQIEKLNAVGLNVVEIAEQFFAVQTFAPADRSLDSTKVVGRNVTNLLAANSIINMSNDTLIQHIENLQTFERQFHKDFKWILYARR